MSSGREVTLGWGEGGSKGQVNLGGLVFTLNSKEGVLQAVSLFSRISNSGQRGSRSLDPFFFHTKLARRKWSVWIRKRVTVRRGRSGRNQKEQLIKRKKIKQPGRQVEHNDHHRTRGVRSPWLGDRRCYQFCREEGNVEGTEDLTLFTEVAFRYAKN